MNEEINITEFTELFPDESSCIAFLEKRLYRSGNVTSPFTGGEAYRIKTRPGIYKCKETRKQFSIRNGTIFEESRLPLKKWFFAIFILASRPSGTSSVKLAKYVGVTQKTSWYMLDRLKYAIEHVDFKNPLENNDEIDQYLIEGEQKTI